MAEHEQRFLPTQAKLEELRDHGVLPYIPATAAIVSFLSVVGGLALCRNSLRELYFGARRGFETGSLDTFLTVLNREWQEVFLIVPAVVALGVLAAGLAQTRFWIEIGRAAPNLERIWRWDFLSLGAQFTRVFYLSFLTLLAAGAALILVWLYGGDGLLLLNSVRGELFRWMEPLGRSVLLTCCVLAVTILFSALLLGRLLFLYRNRMTKEELEAELRSGG